MQQYLKSVMNEEIIKESLDMLSLVDKDKLRSLKLNLTRNVRVRELVNNREISIENLLHMSYEDLANEDVKNRRLQMKKESLRNIVYVKNNYTKEDLDILSNKIEDP